MISVKEATKNYINGGKGKTTMPLGRMFVLAFLAGMFIALAGTAATIASSTVTNSSVAKVITSLVFPAGLAMVIINGTELFTGNNLLIMSVLSKNITVGQMLKNWIVVYIGNFVGSIFVTGFFTLGNIYSMFNSSVAKSVISIATTKCNLSIQEMFFRAILCNILVCVAVMMAATSKTVGGKIIGLFLPIMVFVICGFEHSVANMSSFQVVFLQRWHMETLAWKQRDLHGLIYCKEPFSCNNLVILSVVAQQVLHIGSHTIASRTNNL